MRSNWLNIAPTQIRHFQTSSPIIENVTKEQVQSYLQKSPSEHGFLLLDVREVEEVESNDMPLIDGAKNIPMGRVPEAMQLPDEQFERKFHFPKPKQNQFIVCMCRSGRRSLVVANILKELGYQQVYNYKGSALEWYNK